MNSHPPWGWRWAGLGTLALGTVLLLLVGLYVGYPRYARGRVGDIAAPPLSTSANPPAELAYGLSLPAAIPSDTAPPPQRLAPSPETTPPGPPAPEAPKPVPSPSQGVSPSSSADEEDVLPGGFLPSDLQAPKGYRPVDPRSLPTGPLAPPTRLRIPALGIDSDVQGLRIQNLGNARAYETPKNVVGHIPETAHPGTRGNTWLFGHLESPILGEGSVFQDLPRIYDILKTGYQAYTVVDTDAGSFLYRVREFRKIPRDQLFITSADEPLLTMVTCWPRFSYDQRIVVTAELIGVAPTGTA